MSENRSRGNRLIRLKEVRSLTGISRSYIYALVAQNQFPQSVPLVPGGVSRAWVEAEVLDWVDQRILERDSSGYPQDAMGSGL